MTTFDPRKWIAQRRERSEHGLLVAAQRRERSERGRERFTVRAVGLHAVLSELPTVPDHLIVRTPGLIAVASVLNEVLWRMNDAVPCQTAVFRDPHTGTASINYCFGVFVTVISVMFWLSTE